MAGVWKRDGTIAVTKGSKKVVGTGTTFADPKNAAAKGHLLVMVTGTAVDLYEVDYSESNSVFYLVEAYRGDTGTGKAYAIDTSRTDSIPEFARRLNATLGAYQQQGDAFQALLTSDAATIEVTAPDGTKHTMIPWKRVTSEGEGQAARAKAEADKAAASAALAGSIVEASALPLPDVWAPLSDSLRMITGYGRDITVGDDVIARMLGFSRSTAKTYTGRDGRVKIAAVNEPALERPGLLLEGTSTNLIPAFPAGGSSVKIQKTTHAAFDIPVYRITVAPGATGYVVVPTQKLVSKYTASIWGMVESGSPTAATLQTNYRAADGTLKGAVVSIAQPLFTRRSVTCTNTEVGPQDNYINIINPGSEPCVLLVAGWQLEALPWPSSYIPTDGAAATRAADILPLAAVSNFVAEGTYALEVVNARVAPGSGGRIFWGSSASNAAFYGVRLAPDGELAFLSGASTDKTVIATGLEAFTGLLAFSVGRSCRFGPYTKQLPSALPSEPMASINIGSDAAGNNSTFCHVRNLRGWLKQLSNEQLKAIA